MKVEQHFLGNFVKDGIRYRITPEAGDDLRAYLTEHGYERTAPLQGEALQAAIAAQREADRARMETERQARLASRPAPTTEQLRDKAKAHRDHLLSQGFEYLGKTIQTRNQADIDNINGAALRATNDPAFSTAWITADNSLLPLDAAGIIAMQSAMIARGQAIFAAYLAKAGEIAAATEEQRRSLDPTFSA